MLKAIAAGRGLAVEMAGSHSIA